VIQPGTSYPDCDDFREAVDLASWRAGLRSIGDRVGFVCHLPGHAAEVATRVLVDELLEAV